MEQTAIERMRARVKQERELAQRVEVWSREYGGLTQSQGWQCPRRLLRKKCLCTHTYLPNSPAYHGGCPGCDELQRKLKNHPAYDHPSLWLKDGRPYVFVLQPYCWEEEDESTLRSWCEAKGLMHRVRPKAESWWCPGGTYLIEIFAVG